MRVALSVILLLSASPLFGMLRVAPRVGLQTMPRLPQRGVAPILLKRSFSGLDPFSLVVGYILADDGPSSPSGPSRRPCIKECKLSQRQRIKSEIERDLEESHRVSEELESKASGVEEQKFFARLAKFHRAKLVTPYEEEIKELERIKEKAWTRLGRRSWEEEIAKLEKKRADFANSFIRGYTLDYGESGFFRCAGECKLSQRQRIKSKIERDLEESYRVSKELESKASGVKEQEFFARLAKFHRAKLVIPCEEKIKKLERRKEEAWTDWECRLCEEEIAELEKKKAEFAE